MSENEPQKKGFYSLNYFFVLRWISERGGGSQFVAYSAAYNNTKCLERGKKKDAQRGDDRFHAVQFACQAQRGGSRPAALQPKSVYTYYWKVGVSQSKKKRKSLNIIFFFLFFFLN